MGPSTIVDGEMKTYRLGPGFERARRNNPDGTIKNGACHQKASISVSLSITSGPGTQAQHGAARTGSV